MRFDALGPPRSTAQPKEFEDRGFHRGIAMHRLQQILASELQDRRGIDGDDSGTSRLTGEDPELAEQSSSATSDRLGTRSGDLHGA